MGIAWSWFLACRAPLAEEAPASSSTRASASAAPSARAVAGPSSSTPPKVLAPNAASTLPKPEKKSANEQPQPQKPKPKIQYRVAAVGDSLTDPQVGGGKYLSVLRQRCPQSDFDSYGVGGEMVNQMRRRFKRDVLERTGKQAYTDVIIFGGVNDLYSDLTANRTNPRIQNDLTAMYQMAKQAGLRVIALTVAPWGGFTRYYNERRAQNTRELNAWIVAQQRSPLSRQSATGGSAGGSSSSKANPALVDVVLETTELLSCGDREKLCPRFEKPFKDGLHFGPLGHSAIGEALFAKAFSDCK